MKINTIKSGETLFPQVGTVPTNQFQNVAANSTAFCDLDIGWRYHFLHLQYGGTFTPANMSGIRLIANGEVIYSQTGSLFDTIDQFDGLPAASTNKVLTIPLVRMGLVNKLKEFDTALNTGVKCPQAPKGIGRLRIEVDIGAATAPTLLGFQEVSELNPAQGKLLLRKKVFNENVPGSATNEYLLNTKFHGNVDEPLLTRLYFGETQANLINLRMSEDNVDSFSRTSVTNAQIQARDAIKHTNTAVVIFDTTESGNYNAALRVRDLKSFNVRIIDSNANASLVGVSETLGILSA